MINMRTITVSLSERDYDAFRRAAKRQHRSMDQLIREAIALYRELRLAERTPLTELPILSGHRPLRALPARAEIHDQIFDD